MQFGTKSQVLDRLAKNGLILKYGNNYLGYDRKVIEVAVTQNGRALRYAGDFKNDKEIVMLAVKNAAYAITYASAKLRNDKEFIMHVISEVGYAFRYLEPPLANVPA